MHDYGINIAINNQARPGQAFYNDLLSIFQHLHVRSLTPRRQQPTS